MIVMTGTRVMIVTSVMNVMFVMIVMFDCHFYRFFNVKGSGTDIFTHQMTDIDT